MHDGDTQFLRLARVLAAHEVEYVLVGGLAAVLHGAPIITKDADILHRRTPENIERLLQVLREVQAVYRGDDRRLTPGPSHLSGPGHNLLRTTFGDLDVLGTIGAGMTFDDVVATAVTFEVEGISLRVLDLRRLIESKEQANRPKDRAVLPVLRATLEEYERRGGA